MVSLEEYEIMSALYEARKYLDRYDLLETKMMMESGSIEVLEEGAKEAIQNFIKKVMDGIQGAWNKFKDNVAATKLKWNIEDIKKAVAQFEPKINVDDYVEFIPEPLSGQDFEIKEFNYDAMKDSLDDTKAFMKKFYMSFYKDDTKSISENMRAVCTKPKQTGTHSVDKAELEKMLNYVVTYEEFKKKVEDDLKRINQGTKAIDFLVRNSIKEAATDTNNNRKVALAKAIKCLEDQGLQPKISDREKQKWLETGDSGAFSGSLCIAGLGKDVDKYMTEVNKVLKPIGAKLTPDNYGTAFLKVNEVAYVSEDGEGPANKVSAAPEAEQEKKDNDQSKEVKTHIENYFKYSSEMLSAKLSLSREIFLFYAKVLNQHMDNNKDKFKSKQNQSNNNTDQNQNNIQQQTTNDNNEQSAQVSI